LSLGLFEHPLALLTAALAAVVIVAAVADRFALPAKVWRGSRPVRSPAATAVDFAAWIAVVLLVYALFFAISWRPLYALAGSLSTFIIFTLISRAKFQFIREPLVFSDVALAFLVLRHKEMFYATWLNVAFWVVALGYVFGASALFMIFEEPILPGVAQELAIAAVLVAAAAPGLLLFLSGIRQPLAGLSAALIGKDDIKTLTVRLGTSAALLYGFLAWLGRREAPRLRPAASSLSGAAAPVDAAGKGDMPLLVVWQSESFMDMRHFGVELALPNLDRLRRRAVEWGRMSSVFEGGYTLRTEFSVISGLPPEALGPDASYPYLRAAAYAEIAWPNRLRKAGWNTHFLHPYDRRFFSRDRALPLLGFEAMTMLDGFEHDPRHQGPYVSDMTLSERLLDLCRGDGSKGQFLFAASVENHGPWRPSPRGGGEPLDIYLAILQRSDAALGFLADELDRLDRPVWLAFYGDHAPILKSFADPFPDPRTDYVIVPMARAAEGAAPQPSPVEKAPWELIADMVRHAGLRGPLADAGGAR
jgi:phosphoglycerol transferase MdoB-like AlkP superfamily enzyme